MPVQSKYVFIASMDVDPAKEALFNEVYDTEHIPKLLKVPGVRAVTRITGEPFAMSIGGERKADRARRARATAPSTRSRARTCSSAPNGPRRWRPAAGPARCGPTPATAATRSTRSADFGREGRGVRPLVSTWRSCRTGCARGLTPLAFYRATLFSSRGLGPQGLGGEGSGGALRHGSGINKGAVRPRCRCGIPGARARTSQLVSPPGGSLRELPGNGPRLASDETPSSGAPS